MAFQTLLNISVFFIFLIVSDAQAKESSPRVFIIGQGRVIPEGREHLNSHQLKPGEITMDVDPQTHPHFLGNAWDPELIKHFPSAFVQRAHFQHVCDGFPINWISYVKEALRNPRKMPQPHLSMNHIAKGSPRFPRNRKSPSAANAYYEGPIISHVLSEWARILAPQGVLTYTSFRGRPEVRQNETLWKKMHDSENPMCTPRLGAISLRIPLTDKLNNLYFLGAHAQAQRRQLYQNSGIHLKLEENSFLASISGDLNIMSRIYRKLLSAHGFRLVRFDCGPDLHTPDATVLSLVAHKC